MHLMEAMATSLKCSGENLAYAFELAFESCVYSFRTFGFGSRAVVAGQLASDQFALARRD